jgi:NAD(P)-dependent dehydrogenase (short-subunit alcohol dehydrogenase family)
LKRAVVTGGTRGIGAGVTSVLVENGWHVTAATVSEQEIEGFRASKLGEAVDCQLLDVTDNDQVLAFFDQFDQLDGLVNCAGIIMREAEFDIDVFQKVIDVNLTGTMRCCMAAHEKLVKAKGSIVNTASMRSYFGGAMVPAYSASKGGVALLTKSLASKWAPEGVRVNAVAPGWIATELTDALRADPVHNDPIVNRTPMGRWGTPSEVGEMVAWLLSEKAGFLTGSLYNVDGGYAAV